MLMKPKQSGLNLMRTCLSGSEEPKRNTERVSHVKKTCAVDWLRTGCLLSVGRLRICTPMSHLGRVAKWLTPSHCILVAHRQAAKAAFVWFQNLPRLQGKWKPPGKDSSTGKIRASQPLGDLHKAHKSGEMNSTKITVDPPKKIQAQLPNAQPPQASPKPPDQPPATTTPPTRTSDVALFHAVTSDMRLHQCMLGPEVAHPEHEVVGTIDAS